MDCPLCGAFNSDSATFCSLCLRPLVTRPSDESAQASAKVLPEDVIESVLRGAGRVLDLLCEPATLDLSKAGDVLAADLADSLRESVAAGRGFGDLSRVPDCGARGLSLQCVVQGVNRTASGEVVAVEVQAADVPQGNAGSWLATEVWWFTRRLRQGACKVCAGPLPEDPMSVTCAYCGAGLELGDWMLVKVVREDGSVGSGNANPSLPSIHRTREQAREVGSHDLARAQRVAAVFLDALLAADSQALRLLVTEEAFPMLKEIVEGAEDVRRAVAAAGGRDEVAIQATCTRDSFLTSYGMKSDVTLAGARVGRVRAAAGRADLLADIERLPPTMRSAARSALDSQPESQLLHITGWDWVWTRVPAKRCPECGASLPEADAPDTCLYCGNSTGIGEWLVSSCSVSPQRPYGSGQAVFTKAALGRCAPGQTTPPGWSTD